MTLVGPSALGDTVSVRDPKDDVVGFLDLASVSHHHFRRADGTWRLRHTIVTHDAWKSRRLCRSSDIEIHIRDTNRYVVIYWRQGLKAKVYQLQEHGRALVGRPPVWRDNDRSVTVSLRRRLLGDVGNDYSWMATSVTSSCTCQDTGACAAYVDRAPDQGYIRHEL